MRLVTRRSPNCDARPKGAPVDLLILHYTGMRSAAEALDRLCDPAAKVSAHYLIDEDGTVVALVPEERRAWHAGASWWQGRPTLNDVSLGIELANPGHEWGYHSFPDAQMAAVVELTALLVARFRIPPFRVVGHSDVAPARKADPGELFDWPRLARAGLCPPIPKPVPAVPDTVQAAGALARIGYPGEAQGVPLETVLRAFQRRWRPARCDGALDAATMGLLLAVDRLRLGAAGTT